MDQKPGSRTNRHDLRGDEREAGVPGGHASDEKLANIRGVRILHVVTAFPTTEQDVITPWLVELLKRLRAAGHDVEVFTSAYKGKGDQVFAGIPVHRFRYFFAPWENLTHEETAPDRMKRSLLYRLMPLPFVLAGMFAIWRLARRERYDLIHVHWPLPLALFGWAAQRAHPAPLGRPNGGRCIPGRRASRAPGRWPDWNSRGWARRGPASRAWRAASVSPTASCFEARSPMRTCSARIRPPTSSCCPRRSMPAAIRRASASCCSRQCITACR